MLLSVVMLNYNNSYDTVECVNSLLKVDFNDFNIIIVDNNSKEDDFVKLQTEIRKLNKNFIYLIRNKKNTGSSGGNNTGIKYALENLKSEYILLLNNDTIVEQNIIKELLDVLDNGKYLASTCKVVFDSNHDLIWANGGYFNYSRAEGGNKDFKRQDSKVKREIEEQEYAPFCCLLLSKKVIEKIGYIDESYFMYFEDTDFCYRMKLNGIPIIYTPKTTVFHKVSASTGGFRSPLYLEWVTRNHKKFIYKYFKKNARMLNIKRNFRNILKIGYFLLHFKFKEVSAIVKGYKRRNMY